MDVTISRLDASHWTAFRDVRLAALADSPSAFWASHADEAAYGQRDWTDFLTSVSWFVARWSTPDGSTPDGSTPDGSTPDGSTPDGSTTDDQPVGTVGVLRRPERPAEPEVIGMWVAPSARRHGVASRLLAEVSARAADENAHAMTLWVLQHNDVAARLYSRHGFHFTGEQIALPRDPDVVELRMRKPLGAEPRSQADDRRG